MKTRKQPLAAGRSRRLAGLVCAAALAMTLWLPSQASLAQSNGAASAEAQAAKAPETKAKGTKATNTKGQGGKALALRRLMRATQPRLLDLGDSKQRRAYHEALRLAGIASDSPLYRWSNASSKKASPQAPSSGGAQVFTLLGFASDDAGKTVSSGALYASDAPVHTITLTLVVTDPDGDVVAGGGSQSSGPSAVVNTDQGENPEVQPLTAVATASVLYQDGSHQVYYVSGDAVRYPTRVDNQAPALNASAPANKDVLVCINRATAPGAPAPACNYVLASTDPTPPLQLPVAGSALFDADIDVDGAGKPRNASAKLMMLAPNGAASCPFTELGDAFFDDPGTQVDGKTLRWSLSPLRFDSRCPIAAGGYSFSLVISVSVGGAPAWATVSGAIPADSVTAREVPPVEIVAGCLAKGTLVTLASGMTRPVEQIKAGDKLKSDSANLTVAAVASGVREASVTLTLADGKTLQVSTTHAIPTQRGIVQAQELRLGDTLTVRGGSSRVTRLLIEVLTAPLEVYDLVLTPATVSQTQGSTYYAGGILVGDGAMKAALANAKSEAKEQHP